MTRGTLAAAAAGTVALAALGGFLLPADLPSFESVRAQWRTSDGVLLDRRGEVLDRVRLDFEARRDDWVALGDVSPALVDAVLAAEDRRFWSHDGIDWRGLAGAVRDTLVLGQRRGGSTIAMQVAALLPERVVPARPDWRRKLVQLRVARALSRAWTREQVLEAYLNLATFRGEVQGIGAAAAQLAGKSPGSLDVPDSEVLAALLPSPNASVASVGERTCARATRAGRPADCGRLASVAAELLGGRRASLPPPRSAPQLAQRMLEHPGQRLATTLDGGIQRIAVDVLERQMLAVAGRNVRDGAVLVVDTASGDVLAYVASASTSTAGQVDGVRAHRQAGSTLKPFLYGLAIERRYLTAASLLDDAPVDLTTAAGLYIPQNYDRDFKGLVSVRQALGNSLNVPAIRTLVLTGVEPFRERLVDLGYAGIVQDGEYYGYALALGSAEVSLWEQAQAYRALARGGRWSPLGLRPDRSRAPDRQVMDPRAAFVVADILADPGARVMTFGSGSPLDSGRRISVKTGTSKDMRDNWCVGFSDRYTVAVWIGNFEGDPMHDVSGVTGAAPVWADLVAELHRNLPDTGPSAPAGVVAREVRFAPAVEAPRLEYFVAGTETDRVRGVDRGLALATIRSPADATIIALDPDIPAGLQRVPIEVGGDPRGLRVRVGSTVLGDAARPLLWQPRRGRHQLVLEDASGRALDRVSLQVR